jgi:hypothetical protein
LAASAARIGPAGPPGKQQTAKHCPALNDEIGMAVSPEMDDVGLLPT